MSWKRLKEHLENARDELVIGIPETDDDDLDESIIIDESFDGLKNITTLSPQDIKHLNKMAAGLSEKSKNAMMKSAVKDKSSLDDLISFARSLK